MLNIKNNKVFSEKTNVGDNVLNKAKFIQMKEDYSTSGYSTQTKHSTKWKNAMKENVPPNKFQSKKLAQSSKALKISAKTAGQSIDKHKQTDKNVQKISRMYDAELKENINEKKLQNPSDKYTAHLTNKTPFKSVECSTEPVKCLANNNKHAKTYKSTKLTTVDNCEIHKNVVVSEENAAIKLEQVGDKEYFINDVLNVSIERNTELEERLKENNATPSKHTFDNFEIAPTQEITPEHKVLGRFKKGDKNTQIPLKHNVELEENGNGKRVVVSKNAVSVVSRRLSVSVERNAELEERLKENNIATPSKHSFDNFEMVQTQDIMPEDKVLGRFKKGDENTQIHPKCNVSLEKNENGKRVRVVSKNVISRRLSVSVERNAEIEERLENRDKTVNIQGASSKQDTNGNGRIQRVASKKAVTVIRKALNITMENSVELEQMQKGNTNTSKSCDNFDDAIKKIPSKHNAPENNQNIARTKRAASKKAMTVIKKALNIPMETNAEPEQVQKGNNNANTSKSCDNFDDATKKISSKHNASEKNVSRAKRVASKKAASLINKVLNVSIERNEELEERLKKELKNPIDIYEFTFDPKEEAVTTKKVGKRVKIIDDSGDENNSMKGIVQKLRRMERKKKRFKSLKTQNTKLWSGSNKINLKIQGVPKKGNKNIMKNVATNNVIKDKTELNGNNIQNNKTLDQNKNKERANDNTAILKINSPEKDDEILSNNSYNHINTPMDNDDFETDMNNINSFNQTIKHKMSIQEEICESFTNDLIKYDDTSTHLNTSSLLSDDIMKSLKDLKNIGEKENNSTNFSAPNSSKITVISDRLLQSNNCLLLSPTKKTKCKENANNSNPWRVNILNRTNPHTFTVKDKTFVPIYDQDIVINSTLTDKLLGDTMPTPKKNAIETLPEKQTYQSSILNYISSTKENKKEIIKLGGLFESPRKVLGELNFKQSTPFNQNNLQNLRSPDLSVIKPTRVESLEEINNLFGFSYDENIENIDPQSIKKIKDLNKRSPKKEKLKTVLFKDTNELRKNEEQTFKDTGTPPNIDILFQDIANDEERLAVKKSRRSYENLRSKRKRLPSVESNISDNDSEIDIKIKDKHINKRSKKEEEEAEKLAEHYNSMFEEIEKYDLCIE